MILLSAEQSRQADRIAIGERGIPARTLMENAGRRAFEAIKKSFPDLGSQSVAVVCGKGNNGGDGRIVADLLRDAVRRVRILDVESFSPAALQEADLVVDALFGTGLSRDVQGPEKAIIEEINRSAKWVMALDVPSGLSADTGRPLGTAVRARLTVTMGRPKTGLVLPEAEPYVGRLEVADIGVPPEVYESVRDSSQTYWVTAEDVKPLFSPRKADTHKGTYGHVLLVGGSETKPGAILLAGKSALRLGAGLATVALPDKAFKKFPKNFLELMYEPQPSHRSGSFSRQALARILKLVEGKGSLAIGPGMGTNADTKAIVAGLIRKTELPAVLDADALMPELPSRNHLILTPHPGEMARLTGSSTAAVQKKRIDVARDFATKGKVFLVLKGFRTLIATPEGDVFVNSTGNPGMATAGMGDVLTGVIASLLAQGLSCRDAALAGVWLHGRAGDRVAERLGDRGLLAGDVAEEIPYAVKELVFH